MANRQQSLWEGFVQGVGFNVRSFFARSPDVVAAELRRGGVSASERGAYPSSTNSFGNDALSQSLRIDQDLQSRFIDYEEMDDYPEISTAYDIYADDATMPDMEEGKSVWVTSENKALQKDLDNVLHKRCLIEDDIWGIARGLGKYGNGYAELLLSQQGLIGFNFMPPPTVRRVEDPHGKLIGFLQNIEGDFQISLDDFYKLAKERDSAAARGRMPGQMTVFEDWEVIHWRLRGKHLRSVYGHGVADPARWVFRRLALLEDALLIYKLSRAPSRYAFYVDVGDLDMQRGLAFVNQVKNQFVKRKFVNPITGKLDMRYNPLAHDEDFFVPTKSGKDSTRIEVLQGPDYTETDSLEYNRDKLVAAIKIPKTYLGYGGEANRASLSSEDIRFARTVMRIQREIRSGLRKACRVHMIATGQNLEDEYDIQMSVPSAILELAKLEVLSATADVAARMNELVPSRWLLMKLYKFSEKEAEDLMSEKLEELRVRGALDAEIQGMSMQAQMDVQNGPGGGVGGDEDLGDGQPPEGEMVQHSARPSIQKRLQETRHPLLARGKGQRPVRLSEAMKARRLDWEREFEGGKVSRYAEDKLHEIAKKDPALDRRLRNIEGMLADIRGNIRR